MSVVLLQILVIVLLQIQQFGTVTEDALHYFTGVAANTFFLVVPKNFSSFTELDLDLQVATVVGILSNQFANILFGLCRVVVLLTSLAAYEEVENLSLLNKRVEHNLTVWVYLKKS